MSNADSKLGRLDGITQILPNPDLLVSDKIDEENSDIGEVVNYVNAMNYGLERLEEFPLCLRLIKEIHAKLLEGGRGSNKNPGDFRSTQNWIGPSGYTLAEATFVPPAVPDMRQALADLELDIPALIKIALIHAQFESIHPFLDGNGRVGRLLITFWLCQQEILSKPLLYLSYYFKQNRLEYYDRLMSVRKKGDWEGWIKFFLKGIAAVSDEATESAKNIIQLKTQCEEKIQRFNNSNYAKLLEKLFVSPIISKNRVKEILKVTYPTASKAIEDFCSMNILVDIKPEQHRNKEYIFAEYLNILNKGTELE